MRIPTALSHRHANNMLSVVVMVLAVYILVWPFLPAISLWWQTHFESGNGYTYQTRLAKKTAATKPIPKDDRIVIPALRMDEAINNGLSQAELNKGIWHRPASSSPDKGSNTVLVGHRFTYAGQAVFYNLDKLKPKDKIVVYWQGKEYDYQITGSKVVPPTAIEIENPTKKPTLTLYTCTPLWSAKDRLVILARPI